MKYNLLDSGVGVIENAAPIMRDIKDTFIVSFILPEVGAYIAMFRDESGVEYRAEIKNGEVKVPKQLLTKEQRVGLTVSQISEDKILRTWECATLKIGTFLSLRQTQWQITAGTDDKELFARLSEIERIHAKTRTEYSVLLVAFNELQGEFSICKQETERAAQEHAEQLSELTTALASVKAANEKLAYAYNQAIEVINDLSGRVAALEKNYDPSII